MKKILLSLIALCCSVGMWADDGVTAKVSGSTLNIALTNSIQYVAFQMDITVPAEISNVAAATDRLTQTGNGTTVGDGKFIVAYNKVSETTTTKTYRVIAYNLNNNEITGASGDDILNITLSAAPSASSDIKVDGIIFVKQSGLASATLPNVVGEDGYEMGNVNHDTKVDAVDLALVINYILGKANESNLDIKLANMNGDTKVDAVDLALLINKILGK